MRLAFGYGIGSRRVRDDKLFNSHSTVLVIQAEAGIRAVFEFESKPNLDAGVRRYDELSLRPKPALKSLEG